jgi:hypothetical protein
MNRPHAALLLLLLALLACTKQTPVPQVVTPYPRTATVTPCPTMTPYPAPPRRFVTVTTDWHCRVTPSLDGEVATYVYSGTVVEILPIPADLANPDGWLFVQPGAGIPPCWMKGW